jgi:hypothetical protein
VIQELAPLHQQEGVLGAWAVFSRHLVSIKNTFFFVTDEVDE